MNSNVQDETQAVSVMSALAIMAAVNETILPAFNRGREVASVSWDPTTVLMQRIAAGERADAIVAIDLAMDELAASKLIVPATRVPIAQAVVGIAVRAGAAKPDISTADRLRQALLDAPSIVFSKAGASGIYFEKLIDRLGIGAAVRAKSMIVPAGLTAEHVANGAVEMAIQQVSELRVVPGVEIVGPMPAEVQATTDFAAAVFSEAANPSGAARFIAALVTRQARSAYEATGLVPLFS
jgi:molybdate transport system substrate-binding protein